LQCNGGHLPDVICRKLACNVWVINSVFGHIYRRFPLFLPVSIYYLWPFECVSRLSATLYIAVSTLHMRSWTALRYLWFNITHNV
jgi:hypothetical protein